MKKELFHYGINELVPYIDWSYLLHAWGLNSNMQQSSTAEEVLHDAHSILQELDGKYHTHATFALCQARSSEDDIIVEGTAIPMLRQQHATHNEPNLCLSDFVSPHGDHIGLFATTVDEGFGDEYRNDEYKHLLAQTIADRLAEATATVMHRAVRTDRNLWGYDEEESLTPEELNREAYRGIRPAVGYPSLPDQSIIFVINEILQLRSIGITLTPNGAMHPHSSVCGIMLHHPASRYFSVGKISPEQLQDYALRRGTTPEQIEKFLLKNIT